MQVDGRRQASFVPAGVVAALKYAGRALWQRALWQARRRAGSTPQLGSRGAYVRWGGRGRGGGSIIQL